jgi:hypothetical protein
MLLREQNRMIKIMGGGKLAPFRYFDHPLSITENAKKLYNCLSQQAWTYATLGPLAGCGRWSL